MSDRVHFVTWKWRQNGFRHSYTYDHVNVMHDMIKRNSKGLDCRVICVTDDVAFVRPEVQCYPLWDDYSKMQNVSGIHLPSCYRRLKLFDQATQASLDIAPGDKIVSIDLDAVILHQLAPLMAVENQFVGWAVQGSKHEKVYNGSMWKFTAGPDLQWMWDNFRPERSPREAQEAGFFGSDQGYISHQLAYARVASGWTETQGVLSYPNYVRPLRVLPQHARIVFFHGKRKPWDAITQRESPWIKKYWRHG